MVVVACLLLLLSCSTAGQAYPLSSHAAGWQDVQAGEKAVDKVWPPLTRSARIRGTAEPDEVLVKRTSRSPSHHRSLPPLHGTERQPVPPSHVPPTVPPAPIVRGGPPSLNTAPPSSAPAIGPSAPHEESGSSSKRPTKANRRPRGSLTNNRALKALADREKQNRMMDKIKSGELIDKTRSNGKKYARTSIEEHRAYKREHARRSRSKLTPEQRATVNQQQTERRRQRKALQKAQLEGLTSQGPPSGSRRNREKEQEQPQVGPQEGRQHEPFDQRMEEATLREVEAPPATTTPMSPRPPESSSGFWAEPTHPHLEAVHHRFEPGPSSPSLNLDLSLSAPGSSTSGQRQASSSSRQDVPPPARTLEEQRIRLTIAPSGQHNPPDEHDKLRFTLASPRHA